MQHTLRKTEMRCALFTPQTVNGVSSHLRRVNSIFGHLAALAKRLFALPVWSPAAPSPFCRREVGDDLPKTPRSPPSPNPPIHNGRHRHRHLHTYHTSRSWYRRPPTKGGESEKKTPSFFRLFFPC